jgi:hypothetical protein
MEREKRKRDSKVERGRAAALFLSFDRGREASPSPNTTSITKIRQFSDTKGEERTPPNKQERGSAAGSV